MLSAAHDMILNYKQYSNIITQLSKHNIQLAVIDKNYIHVSNSKQSNVFRSINQTQQFHLFDLIITSCGMGVISKCMSSKIPMLCIPYCNDQWHNAGIIKSCKIG